MSVPPPPSPVAQPLAYFVGDTGARCAACRSSDDTTVLTRAPAAETFFEPHAQLRLPRASLKARGYARLLLLRKRAR